MQSSTPTTESVSHNYRDRYIPLGVDADGGTHLYRTVDETVFAFDADGHPEHRFDIPHRPVDDYVDYVDDVRGWADCRYGMDNLVDRLLELV